MISFTLSCIVIFIVSYRMLTLFQLNFIEKIIQKYKFNNGICKCGNKFTKTEPDFMSSSVEYECEQCSKTISIDFDSINNKYLKDNHIEDNEYYKYKTELEKEIGII